MKKNLIMAISAAMAITVFSCNKHESNSTIPKSSHKVMSVSYEETDSTDIEDTNDASEDLRIDGSESGRLEVAKIPKNSVIYELKGDLGFLQNVYDVKYWLYPNATEPDLTTLKSSASIYGHPSGIIKKKGTKTIGTKSLPSNKWIVFEEQTTKTMYKFHNECLVGKCKHFVGMATTGATKFPTGFQDSIGTVKVSNQWGLVTTYDPFTVAWFDIDAHPTTTDATILAMADPLGSADGYLKFSNTFGKGVKKYQTFKLPIGNYIFFFRDAKNNISLSDATVTKKKTPYLKLEENQ